MPLQFGDVVLIRMPFHQATASKIRPAIVLLDSGDDDFVAVPITSHARRVEYDLAIEEWRMAALNVPSFIRVDKLTVLTKEDILRILARLTETDRQSLRSKLHQIFCQESSSS